MEKRTARIWDWRVWVVLMIVLVTIVAVFLFPPIPQSQTYHNFADRRTLIGIPNCLNVVSNVFFLLVGGLGICAALYRLRSPEAHTSNASIPSIDAADSGGFAFTDPRAAWSYFTFFLGVMTTALGSAYYHLNPSDGTLLWDRIPMAIGFMALVSATVSERISAKAGLQLLFPLLTLGVVSVVYWEITQKSGYGDLRPYALAQFGSVLIILLLVGLFPPRYTRGSDLIVALAIYAFAKILEAADGPIFLLGGIASGHTLKHIAAAISAFWIFRMLRLRRKHSSRATC
jgi:hypothetical protein